MACGGCVQGCIFGSKSSADLVAISRGLATGNLMVRPQAKAFKLEARQGRVTAVVYTYQQIMQRVEATSFVLALGAVETPRLLLDSNTGDYPAGLGNTYDQVGRYCNRFRNTYTGLEQRCQDGLHHQDPNRQKKPA